MQPRGAHTLLRARHTVAYRLVAAMSVRSVAHMPEDRRRVLDQSWSYASRLYLRELVPRFVPWFVDGLKHLLERTQPSIPADMPVLLPCCGPGHEIPVVFRALQGRNSVVGSDLAEGMVALANIAIQGAEAETTQAFSHVMEEVAKQLGNNILDTRPDQQQHSAEMSAEQLDACLLDEQHAGQAAAVLSVFGLQQLGPLAPQALAAWARCLAPRGRLVVVLWPSAVEDPGGPWAAYDQALKQILAEDQQQGSVASTAAREAAPPQQAQVTSWEQDLSTTALQVPGCRLVCDRYIQHTMAWPDEDHFWKVMTHGGPWHARRLVSGDAFMDRLHQAWLGMLHSSARATAQQTTVATTRQPLVHSPRARLIIIDRDVGGETGARDIQASGSRL